MKLAENIMSKNYQQPPTNEDTILIVEQDVVLARVLSLLIEVTLPYKTRIVYNGYHALRVADQIHPVLCVINYELVGINGLILYDQLTARPEFSRCPVLMIDTPPEELSKRHLKGIQEPFAPQDFLANVQQLLGLSMT